MDSANFFGVKPQQAPLTNAQIQAQIKAALDAQSQTFAPQNPFTGAMSGTQSGTLQPYVNHQTDLASQALNGGLLNYHPQSFQSGAAGGSNNPLLQRPTSGFGSGVHSLSQPSGAVTGFGFGGGAAPPPPPTMGGLGAGAGDGTINTQAPAFDMQSALLNKFGNRAWMMK